MKRMDRSIFRGAAIILISAAIIAAIILIPQPPKPTHPPNDDPWLLVSYDPNNEYGTYLGNGFISTRIYGEGVGNHDGKPVPCFMAGLYDNEKLIPTPTWSDLAFHASTMNGCEFKIDKTAPYKQTLDMRTGMLTTEAAWKEESTKKILKGRVEVIVSRAQPNVALVRAKLWPQYNGMLIAYDSHSGEIDSNLVKIDSKALNADTSYEIYSTKHSKITLAIAHTLILNRPSSKLDDVNPQSLNVLYVKNGKPITVLSYTAIATGPTANIAKDKALAELHSAVGAGDHFISAHKTAWANLWKRDIIIDGSKRDQQAVHSCLFYLLESVREGSQWSIPPMGLSDNAFSGHVFWDADTWMFSALILQRPELARSIVDYRYNTLPGAIANAKVNGYKGADYAWESGYTGKDDTPPGLVYRNERHINGDVALAQWQYYLATADLNWLKTRGYPVIKAIADYWSSRATFNTAKDRYEIKLVVPPDENAELVNNSAYTNAIAQLSLEIAVRAAKLTGQSPDPAWSKISSGLYIPFDSTAKRFNAFESQLNAATKKLVPFDGYKRTKSKQADTELLIYPLQYKFGSQSMTDIYKNTFSFYSTKVDRNGPAMTSSAYSIIAARLRDRDRAYSEFTASYKPFLRGPMNYFNEKRSRYYTNMCFLTGAAGPLQSAIFGLAGAQIDYFSSDPAQTQLHFSPCLPKQWKSLKITGIQWHGKIFDLTIYPGDKPTLAPAGR